MTDPLTAILRRRPVVILDGGLATALEHAGHDLSDPLWSAKILLEQPGAIADVHRAYFDAGADCATTATYQATVAGLVVRGRSVAQAEAAILSAVAIATTERDRATTNTRPDLFVAASIGPYGAYLADGSEYRGRYGLSVAALVEFHRPRFRLLAQAGQLLACETIPDVREAEALMILFREHPDTVGWLSFSCTDAEHTCAGDPIGHAAALAAANDQIVAVGINCTAPPHVEPLVRAMAPAAGKPIVVYPNAGEGYQAGRGWTGPAVDDATFVALAQRWYDAGARVIGGCCRTTPATIAALRRWADGLRSG